MKNTVVEVKAVTKTFAGVKALDGVAFQLDGNKIYGLLGRNGAGKTTLLHILTAQQFATSGEVLVNGEPPYENDRVLRQLCFIKESQQYPRTLKVQEVLELSSSFFPNWDRDYAYELIRKFELPLTRRMGKLSRGMLSSVGIIIGLASRAPITVFDEPYLGLDAVARGIFYEQLLEDYAEHPRTIVLSTHLIDEVSLLLEHVLVLDRGRIVVNESTEKLRDSAYTVTGPRSKTDAFADGAEVIHRESLGGLSSVTMKGPLTLELRTRAERLGLELGPVSLQQLFIHVTNTSKAEGKAASGQ